MKFLENGCNVEAVYEERCTPRAIRVREEMEELKPAWVGLERVREDTGEIRRLT
jgi:hypothetical protein